MEGFWSKQWKPGRRFVLKISPGEPVAGTLVAFAETENVRSAVVTSAVGSVENVRFRGIKAGAKLPITEPRMHVHEVAGPLELVGLEGNILPDSEGRIDCHLHIMVGKSTGEILGGHFFDATVFASCEILVTEMDVAGIERHRSRQGGVPTLFIEEEE